jgi:hypothetical protein
MCSCLLSTIGDQYVVDPGYLYIVYGKCSDEVDNVRRYVCSTTLYIGFRRRVISFLSRFATVAHLFSKYKACPRFHMFLYTSSTVPTAYTTQVAATWYMTVPSSRRTSQTSSCSSWPFRTLQHCSLSIPTLCFGGSKPDAL